MNIEQLNPNDRVRVTLPAASSSQAGIEAEVTVVRVGKEKTALVVRMANGQLKTLPIANVKEKLGVGAPPVKPAMGEAAVIAVFESKHGSAEEIPAGPGPEPEHAVTVDKVQEDLAASSKPVPAVPKAPKPKAEKVLVEKKPKAEKVGEEKKSKAADIMEQADEMSKQAQETLKVLKPTRAKKEKVAKAPGVSKPRLTKEQLEERKANIKKDVDEGILSNKEIAIKYNVDAAIVSNARTGYVRYKPKTNE